MVPQGNGVRSALLQALVAGRGTNGGALQRMTSRLGGGVPQTARLQALIARMHGGGQHGHSMHPTGGQNDPLSTALGHHRTPQTPDASRIDPAAGGPELENSGSFQGGPGRNADPDISPIMELISGINPAHFPALLQHLSQLVAGQGAQAPVGPPVGHPGPVQY